ncbi:hypothetical protein GLX27_001423 [Malassezia furfur]|uniref:Uncharacterized protein n=1 Tax=Malassezia furfur TaxID=55194 RepID=A0ABY8EMJ9_MALFU|nr:hypothetical protein GLX27_001423 [Malassezia furfur]
MWDAQMRTAPTLTPPSILVSPPAADIESVLAHTRQNGHALHRLPIRHEWQFAFVSTLLARDHSALAKLQWQLDLAFAALACPPAHADALVHRPRLAARLAHQTAHAVVHLLRRAWKPSTPAEFAYSPPSFRESSATREPLAPGALGAAHTAWAQHLSGVLGAEMVDKIAAHIIQALWYMATQDRQRTFARPAILAHFCAACIAQLDQWEYQEARGGSRLLPHRRTHHAARTAPVTTPTALRNALEDQLRARFDEARDAIARAARTTHTLQVPTASPERGRALAAQPKHPALRDAALVDAARFLGELCCQQVMVDTAVVVNWLDTLLLAPRAWVHVPLCELEAACALLLLVAPHWDAAWLLDGSPVRQCSLTADASQSTEASGLSEVMTRCVHRLEELVQSTLVPDVTKEWVNVRNVAKLTCGAYCAWGDADIPRPTGPTGTEIIHDTILPPNAVPPTLVVGP